jgi:flagellar biogenesis protein FliO
MTDLLFPILALFVIVVYVINRIRSNRRFKK